MRATVSQAGEGAGRLATRQAGTSPRKNNQRTGQADMAGWRLDVRLFNSSILVLLLGLQTPLSCLSLASIGDQVDDNSGYHSADLYRSREPDVFPETDPGFGRLVTRYGDIEPNPRFTDNFASSQNDIPPVVVANAGNSINYENLPDGPDVKNLERPAKHEMVERSDKEPPAGSHRSHVPPVATRKDDLIGSAIRGQKEEVQGDRNVHMNQLSNQESYSSPHARSYEYESRTRGRSTFGDIYFVTIVAGCSIAAMCGVMGTGYCLYRLQQHNKAAADVDYPAYGVVGPITKDAGTGNSSNSSGHSSPSDPGRMLSSSPITGAAGGMVPGDRKLAQNAQMYHYHHQKHQMQAAAASGTSRTAKEVRLTSTSDPDSDEDEVEYIVYECPGLAPTGEMEVKNPLFQDDSTPASPMRTPVKTSPNGKAAGADVSSRD